MLTLPVSAPAWRSLIAGPTHNIAVLGQVYAGADPDRVLYDGLPVLSGNVTVDAYAPIRRTLDLTLVDDDDRFADAARRITPGAVGDLFSPYGSMVRIQYGVEVPGYTGPFGDSYAWFEQGWFRIAQTGVKGDGTVRITASDLSRTVARAAPVVPLVVPAGTLSTTAIVTVIAGGLPPAIAQRTCYDLAQVVPSGEVTPLVVLDVRADRWVEATRMAAAIGYEVFFGEDSGLVLRPVPDLTSQEPAVRFVEGETAALLEADRELSDDPGYNGVVLDAEATNLPVPLRSIVWDTDPDSPTYHLGPYGQVPRFVTSPYVATQAQADAAARAELTKWLRRTDRTQIAVIPDPALQVQDVSEIRRTRSGIDDLYRTDRQVLPLGETDAMTLTCRPRSSYVPDAA